MDAILVFITAGSEEEAERIASTLVESRLAACVNRVREVRSLFWWRGEQDSAEEVLLLVKTRREHWEALLERVRAVHSYEVFEAIAVPILLGSPEYLRWIEDSTHPPGQAG